MLIPRAILNAIGYFDEKFPQYGSDTDFCYRARETGFDIFISYKALIFSEWTQTGKGDRKISFY